MINKPQIEIIYDISPSITSIPRLVVAKKSVSKYRKINKEAIFGWFGVAFMAGLGLYTGSVLALAVSGFGLYVMLHGEVDNASR